MKTLTSFTIWRCGLCYNFSVLFFLRNSWVVDCKSFSKTVYQKIDLKFQSTPMKKKCNILDKTLTLLILKGRSFLRAFVYKLTNFVGFCYWYRLRFLIVTEKSMFIPFLSRSNVTLIKRWRQSINVIPAQIHDVFAFILTHMMLKMYVFVIFVLGNWITDKFCENVCCVFKCFECMF